MLANYSEENQEIIFGSEVFANSKIFGYHFDQGNINEFLDIIQQAISVSFRTRKNTKVLLNGFENKIREIELPVYEEDLKIRAFKEIRDKDYARRRLIAAKLQQECFPVTESFKKDHFKAMDLKMGLGC